MRRTVCRRTRNQVNDNASKRGKRSNFAPLSFLCGAAPAAANQVFEVANILPVFIKLRVDYIHKEKK